jgi:hypothetical protein
MGKRLIVGNLSFQTTQASLEAAFGQDGRKVTSVSVVQDRDTGRSRGFAFVEVANGDAQAAIKAMDGKRIDGRQLHASTKPRAQAPGRWWWWRPGYSGDRRGGGGGGGGGREALVAVALAPDAVHGPGCFTAGRRTEQSIQLRSSMPRCVAAARADRCVRSSGGATLGDSCHVAAYAVVHGLDVAGCSDR